MNNPSPAALAIASLIEAAIAPIFATMSAPLLARIEKLEKGNSLGEPTPEFVQKTVELVFADARLNMQATIDAVLVDSKFDDAVINVLNDRNVDAMDNLIDNIKERISEDSEDKIASVLRNGSFSIEFSRY